MNNKEFQELMDRREELEERHRTQCEILAEEPSRDQQAKCLRLYAEIEEIQAQIDAELEDEETGGAA